MELFRQTDKITDAKKNTPTKFPSKKIGNKRKSNVTPSPISKKAKDAERKKIARSRFTEEQNTKVKEADKLRKKHNTKRCLWKIKPKYLQKTR